MVARVATDEGPLETPSSDESGLGKSCDLPSEDSEPEAALVVPPDGGWGWVVLVGSFVCNVVVDGIIFSFGSMLPAIREDFKATEGQVATVNSLLTGFYLLAGPFVSALANKYGFRVVTILGTIISSAAIALSFFANSIEYLYFVYGIVGGIGFCMIYMTAVVVVGYYFEKWRALATGLSLCGSGVGTFVMAPLNTYLVTNYQWRHTLLFHAALVLLCAICGAIFRPIKPVRVTLADQSDEEDSARRHEVAVEKLNSMLKLQSNLDSGRISMPPEIRFSNKASPHTWVGVANNTQYPTAEEIFRGSNSHLNKRRLSANATTLRNNLGNKPMFITVPVAEKDEQEDSNSNNDNTEPLIGTSIKVVSREVRPRRSHMDLIARPLYRDDIFFGASLNRLPQYTSRTSLAYHLAVTHVPTKQETQEERTGKCRICPEAIKRTLATMLDFNLLSSPTFLIFALSGMFTMMGYLVPFLSLCEKAKLKGLNTNIAEMLIPAIGISNIIGRVSCGLISAVPKVSPLWVNNIAISLGGIASILCGLCYHPAYQFAYCVFFGLSIACFSALRSILVVEYLGLEKLTNCFGLFLLFQGLGASIGGPMAGALKDGTGNWDAPYYMSGFFFLLSAIMCFPIDRVSRWEKTRQKTKSNNNLTKV